MGVPEAEKRNDLSILAIGDSDNNKKTNAFLKRDVKKCAFCFVSFEYSVSVDCCPAHERTCEMHDNIL